MSISTLHIKNMVCNRCIKVVNEELSKFDMQIESIELGKVELASEITNQMREEVRSVLHHNGFELIDDKKSQIIDTIKTIIIEKIHHDNEVSEHVNSSEILVKETGYDYFYLSKLFSSEEGITIEKYIILQKIEKAKELLAYNELSVKEIAYRLGYSSVQHLSNQFKKVTGLRPSNFKQLNENHRKPLDQV